MRWRRWTAIKDDETGKNCEEHGNIPEKEHGDDSCPGYSRRDGVIARPVNGLNDLNPSTALLNEAKRLNELNVLNESQVTWICCVTLAEQRLRLDNQAALR